MSPGRQGLLSWNPERQPHTTDACATVSACQREQSATHLSRMRRMDPMSDSCNAVAASRVADASVCGDWAANWWRARGSANVSAVVDRIRGCDNDVLEWRARGAPAASQDGAAARWARGAHAGVGQRHARRGGRRWSAHAGRLPRWRVDHGDMRRCRGCRRMRLRGHTFGRRCGPMARGWR